MSVIHIMISESRSKCGRLVTQGTGADCKNCARTKSPKIMNPATDAPLTTTDLAEIAIRLNGELTAGDILSGEDPDTGATRLYRFVDATRYWVYFTDVKNGDSVNMRPDAFVKLWDMGVWTVIPAFHGMSLPGTFDESDPATWVAGVPAGYTWVEQPDSDGESHLIAPDGRNLSKLGYARRSATPLIDSQATLVEREAPIREQYRALSGAPEVTEVPAPFRTHGKVKSTSRSRKYRRGA